jgi:hypothetical protein
MVINNSWLIMIVSIVIVQVFSEITCDDKYECMNQDLGSSDTINCLGYQSCKSAWISNVTNYLNCYGYQSCSEMDLSYWWSTSFPKGNVLCHGGLSCESSNINTNGILYCSSLKSCQSSNIYSPAAVYSYGLYSNQNNYIYNAKTIYANGAYSYNLADIEIKGITSNIYFYGLYSGQSSSIHCQSGSTCNVYCLGSSCYNTTIYCYTGSLSCKYTHYNETGPVPNIIYTTPAPTPREPW